MKTLLSVLFTVFFVFGSVYGYESGEEFFAADRAKAESAYKSLRMTHPQARTYKMNGRVSKVYGTALETGSSPENSAQKFVDNYAEIFSADRADLTAGSLLRDGQKVIPMMYDKVTGRYKFKLVYYRQERQGIPVFGADLRVLVRNEAGYPVVLASSALRSLNEYMPLNKASVSFDQAKFAARREVPSLDKFSDQEVVIWAGYNDKDEIPRTAVSLIGFNDQAERWQFVVDAETGEVLYKEDLIIFEDIAGNVQGNVTQGEGAEQCEVEANEPFRYARVNVGTTQTYTDENGDYLLSNGGTSPVTVQTRPQGQWFQVYNYTGTDLVVSRSVTPPGPGNLVLNYENTSESVRAQVNAYVEANVIRDMVLTWNPSFPTMMDTDFPIYTNRTDFYCPANAWYDPGDVSLNFCSSSGSYPNTAWSSVIHHEYGHHLVDAAGSGQGQYGEGFGDCMSVVLADSPDLGLGFYGDCNTPLRTADNSYQYPCTSDIHDCAQLLSGCIWDVRNALVGSEPNYLEVLQNLTVNSVLLHTGDQITPQITIDFLTLDDDDADLDNGTPHWFAICAGFDAHNMDCPELSPIWFSYPNGFPENVEPGVDNTFQVQVNASGDTPVPGTGMFHYSINGAPYSSVLMTELSSNLYEATFPSVTCGDTLEWYVTADAVGFGEWADPPGAPITVFNPTVATSVLVAFDDDFETDMGWTISGGQWQRGTPTGGGGSYGEPDPSGAYEGSNVMGYNLNGDYTNNMPERHVTSPMIDCTDLTNTTLKFQRWLGVERPLYDHAYIRISTNGTSWTTIWENDDYVTDDSWVAQEFDISSIADGEQIYVRFTMGETDGGWTYCGWNIDNLVVVGYQCESNIPAITTESIPDWTAGYPFSLELTAVRGVGVLTWSDKNGDLAGTGLSLAGDGMLTGTPVTGSISFTALVTDEEMQTDEKVFSFIVNESVNIAATIIPDWTQGFAMSHQMEVNGGTLPVTWVDPNSDLDGTGLSLTSEGLMAGTPATAGPISFTARAVDQIGSSDEILLEFNINAPVEIMTTEVPNGIVGNPYSVQLEAQYGTGELTWSDKNNDLFLSGISLSSSGFLSGTSYMAKDISFTALVTDEVGAADERQFTFTIGNGVQIEQIVLPATTMGIPYSQQLTATGGVGEVTWNDKDNDLDGTGLSLSASGLITGTPTQAGTITFTAEVNDEGGGHDERQGSITINSSVSFVTSALPDWTVNKSYSVTLEAAGGTGSISWSNPDSDLDGTGLALSGDGELSGIPTAEGTITFTARISDDVGDQLDHEYQVLINPAVVIATTAFPNGVEGETYSMQLEASGGTGAYAWSDKNGDLFETGLTILGTGIVSGTPTNWGTIGFTAVVRDVAGSTAESFFDITIQPPYICGDLNDDDLVNLLDITDYIDWKFKDGTPADPPERADVNNDGKNDLLDILYLIEYKFKDGPEPDCGFDLMISVSKGK